MDKIEELEQYIYDNGIDLLDTKKLNEQSMIVKDFDYEYVTIAINSRKMNSRAEKLVALSHEVGHYNTSGYYYPFMPVSYKRKVEHGANVDSIKRRIPIKKLKQILNSAWCNSRWEIAEAFGVTEDFVDMAIEIYKQKGLLTG